VARDSIFLKADGSLDKQGVMNFLNLAAANFTQMIPAMLETQEKILRSGVRENIQLGLNAMNLTGMIDMDIAKLKEAVHALPS